VINNAAERCHLLIDSEAFADEEDAEKRLFLRGLALERS